MVGGASPTGGARYRRREPPGVAVRPAGPRTVACESGGDVLLHLLNMDGSTGPVTVELSGRMGRVFRSASLEPQDTHLEMRREQSLSRIEIPAGLCDRIDTIVRLKR